MIDPSYGVRRLPGPEDPLTFGNANCVEENLRALILAWPAFETETVRAALGSWGYLQLDESAAPSGGVRVAVDQHLPRILVLLEGEGLEHVHFSGFGWEGLSPGVLVYTVSEPYARNANAALATLIFHADGDADLTVTVAAENTAWEPDGLRLTGLGRTRMLFTSRCTWGYARAKKLTWGGAKPLTWGQAAALRKE